MIGLIINVFLLLLSSIGTLVYAQGDRVNIDTTYSIKDLNNFPEAARRFKIDSTQVELYFNGELFAVIPGYMQNLVSKNLFYQHPMKK